MRKMLFDNYDLIIYLIEIQVKVNKGQFRHKNCITFIPSTSSQKWGESLAQKLNHFPLFITLSFYLPSKKKT